MKNESTSELALGRLFVALLHDKATAKSLLNTENCNAKLGTLKETPLHFTARNKNLELAKYLLDELGANPNSQDQGEETPLHFAARNGDIKMIKLLITYGANPHIKAKCFGTPKTVLLDHGFQTVLKEMEIFIAEQKKMKENQQQNPPILSEPSLARKSPSPTNVQVLRHSPVEQRSVKSKTIGNIVLGTATNFFKSFLPDASSSEESGAKQALLPKKEKIM